MDIELGHLESGEFHLIRAYRGVAAAGTDDGYPITLQRRAAVEHFRDGEQVLEVADFNDAAFIEQCGIGLCLGQRCGVRLGSTPASRRASSLQGDDRLLATDRLANLLERLALAFRQAFDV